MAEVVEVKPCSNPGCVLPGTSACSACKTSFYCGPICQTAHWAHHKEECSGHLRKVGKVNLDKAKKFLKEQQNWVQTLRYAEVVATKLKQLKDRRLETVQAIDLALTCKFNALQQLNRHREALKCIKENYTLWAMNHLRNPGSMHAALGLIESCLHNGEFEDAENYARHAYFMIAEMTDNFIPSDEQPWFLAEVSYYLSRAIVALEQAGGIPPEGKQKAGEEAIKFARQALKLFTQLHGIESAKVAMAKGAIAEALDHFNDVDDDEVPRLYERANSVFLRVEGCSSYNVATNDYHLGNTYLKRAKRSQDANDADRCFVNLELALRRFREALRIFQTINHVDAANDTLRQITNTEEKIRQVGIARVTAATASKG